MNTMNAALYKGIREIEWQEVEYKSPEPGYITLQTRSSGICGSDLHNYFGEWKAPTNRAAGHELCGNVTEVGEGVTDIKPGDLVTAECFTHCGTCHYCIKGMYNHCTNRQWFSGESHGGFAEYTTVHQASTFVLPDMTFEQGALVEPLAVAHRALAQANASYQDRVAVIGGGTIGQLCLAVAKAIGVRETLITTKYPQQADLARDLGADHVVDITNTDVKDVVKDLTDGLGYDAVIETVGTAQNFNDSIAIARRQAMIVLVAGYFKPLEVDLRSIVWSEVNITGSNCYGFSGMRTDFDVAIDLITSGRVEATKLVTHRYPFSDIAEAFHTAADKKSGSVKVHLVQED